ncbi:FAD-dependent tricarballylate dehydrogenase TcuA [Shouchella shacheensis]|uniref:FAD-dependent tricarballylate dehydrogenase TcuA n=1 Tax=Shouchella shacheensis TaxID=1649580 RepID=UPI00073FC402|nr:FAD-dependent tricarballylate dehydrogenase TcuA [Shouchella shacheensis]
MRATEEPTVDVVIVGAGNAALCSAIAASENGSKVLVLEKGPEHKRGGNSFFTDGAIRCAYNDIYGLQSVIPELTDEVIQGTVMPTYQESDFMDDLKRVTKGKSDPALAQQLVIESFPTIQWMHKQGVVFELNENQYFVEQGKRQFWGGLPMKTERKGIGLIETLFNRAIELGVDVWYGARAIEIQTEGGKASAVVVEKDGTNLQVKTKVVVLACGGFEANTEKRMEHIGQEWEKAVVRGSEYNTGDGLEMALAIGAQAYGDWSGCHAHTTDYEAPRVGDYAKPGDIYKKSSYPLGLIVNTGGKRFVDEGADFRNYTYAKYGKETLKQPNQKAFQLFDAQVRSHLRTEYDLEEATCLKADTLDGLAEKMGIDTTAFKETVETYNQAVQEGDYNPGIKDGKSTKGVTPPKSNWALRFKQAPFYAYPVTCGITFTFGGIHVSPEGEVLDKEETPLPGVFAAGEMVGGLFYHNYPGGSGLMSGAVFGKLAGESAARFVKRREQEGVRVGGQNLDSDRTY